ncbi:MAG: secretin N-terminal domain-containing protein [bacterium]
MKFQRREYWLWMPFLLVLVCSGLVSVFAFSPSCQAERRKPYDSDISDHDFPYENCSLRAVDADVRNVLRAFADRYRLSIIMSEDVQGKISIIVNDIPVKEAFKSILNYADLGFIKEGDIYRIRPLEKLLAQETSNQKVEELRTEIIPLKYANAERLIPNLSKFKTNLPETVVEADKWTNSVVIKDTAEKIEEVKALISKLDIAEPLKDIKEVTQSTKIVKLRYIKCLDVAQIKALEGKVSAHEPTNSVIITDLPENIGRLTSIIEDLDKPVCQIMIDAKIVETTKSYSNSFGIQWGGRSHFSPPSGKTMPTISIGGAMGGSNFDGSSSNYAVNVPTTTNAYGGVDLMLGHIKDKMALNLRLSAMEDSGNGRIISQPRIMALDNTQATISSGEIIQLPPILYTGTTIVTGGANQENSTATEKEAKTKLVVTPHIISDNQVQLTINISRDTPDFSRTINNVPVIYTREAETELILSNGETAVIGGLAITDTSQQQSAIPWLSKIPLIGWLFKGKTNRSQYGELLVFITPHIVQAQQAKN